MIRSFAGIDTERPLIVNLLFCDKSQYTVLNVLMTLTYTFNDVNDTVNRHCYVLVQTTFSSLVFDIIIQYI